MNTSDIDIYYKSKSCCGQRNKAIKKQNTTALFRQPYAPVNDPKVLACRMERDFIIRGKNYKYEGKSGEYVVLICWGSCWTVTVVPESNFSEDFVKFDLRSQNDTV